MEADSGFPSGDPLARRYVGGETYAPDVHIACRRKNVERWNDGFFKGLTIGVAVAVLAVFITIAVMA